MFLTDMLRVLGKAGTITTGSHGKNISLKEEKNEFDCPN